jgi:endo-1,4-beta-D-glucanase Y
LVVAGLIVVALVAQSLNMFNYPSFTLKDDEGIYAAQAWAVLREGSLAPYTYFYDHAPGGWLLLAGWYGLTGGMYTFGNAIDSGRVLMLLLHLAMVPLFYQICRKLGSSVSLAALVTLLFSVSPLALFYQRMVLLDNIMMFWLLLSLNLLLDGWGRLSRVILSGICFGLAILCKETAVFMLPALLFIAWQQRWKHQGRFGLGGWLLPVALVISFYPLYALLKSELVPAGFPFFGSSSSEVSLLGAVKWQATRAGEAVNFADLVRQQWLPRDAVLFGGGLLASIVNLLRGFRNRKALAAGLLGILPLVYLARGGLVFDYYLILAIPFFCLNLGVLLSWLVSHLRFYRRSPRLAGIGLAVVFAASALTGYWLNNTAQPLYAAHPDLAGREAVSWIKQHVPADSMIIMRDDMWVDLHEAGTNGPAFPNAHTHWKVATDPAVSQGIFKGDWHNVDYLIMSGGLKETFEQSQPKDTLALDALNHAHLVKRWESERGDESLHAQQIVELWKVDKPGELDRQVLSSSAAYLSHHFEQAGAYKGADGTVTSESQSYALLRAIWSNDKAEFYQTWNWTKANLLNSKGLLSWQWRDGAISDGHSATDADTDTALALLMAGKYWNDPALVDEGRRMAQAVWQQEVVTVNNKPYLIAGDWANGADILAINPSYFAPYAYRIFQQVDPSHDWQGLIDSGYQVVFDSAKALLGSSQSAGLPPDWVGLDRESGELVPLKLDKANPTRYGYDAPRTYWRIALDLQWSKDGRAETFLKQAGFLRDEVNRLLQDGITRKNLISAVYEHDGTVVQEAPSMVGSAGGIAALLTLDPGAANTIYARQVVGGQLESGQDTYWGDPNDLYTQEWGWFGLAFYNGALPNLWYAPQQAG